MNFCCVCMLSRFIHVRLFVAQWTVVHQAPLSMGFSRQEYLSGLPSPPLGYLPVPGIELASLRSPALAKFLLEGGNIFLKTMFLQKQNKKRELLLYIFQWPVFQFSHCVCVCVCIKLSEHIFKYLDHKFKKEKLNIPKVTFMF